MSMMKEILSSVPPHEVIEDIVIAGKLMPWNNKGRNFVESCDEQGKTYPFSVWTQEHVYFGILYDARYIITPEVRAIPFGDKKFVHQ